MTHKIRLLFLLVMASFSAFGQAKPYKIISIKAYLYYNAESLQDPGVRGTLSENLIDNGEFALWNTIIGEGSAKAASSQTFVVVELKGNPKEYVHRKVVLTATARGRQVFRQSQYFSILNDGKAYSAAFLLYDTGCEELKLKAEIIDEKTKGGKKQFIAESSLAKTIPFACGE